MVFLFVVMLSSVAANFFSIDKMELVKIDMAVVMLIRAQEDT